MCLISHSDSFSDIGSWPCSENILCHCWFYYLFVFNHSLYSSIFSVLLLFTYFVLLHTLQSGDGRLHVLWHWVCYVFSEVARISSGCGAEVNADYLF